MKSLALYRTVSRLGSLSYRAKILVFAAAACLPGFAVAFSITSIGTFIAAVSMTGLLLLSLHLLLRPIKLAAEAATDGKAASALPRDFRDEAGRIMAGIAALSERAGALQHRAAQRHPITGLPTREHLLAELLQDFGGGDAVPTMMGVVRFADHDRLSAFDPEGAELALKSFGEMLAAAVGKSRPLAHVGRDSFAIWFRGSAPETAATELQAICYALGGELAAGDLRLVPDLEAGAATYPDDSGDAQGLINRALLTLAKTSRKAGKLQLLPPKPVTAAREEFALEQDLRHAIAREQLELHYQPVIDVAQGGLVGAEALIRWRHPEAGMISPGRFIPILEDANLIDEIGLWTLNAACREARGWQRRGLDGLKVAVNLSARQLQDPNLVQMIDRTLQRHKLSPALLELELTETAATEDADRTFALFGELRALGISLAIDDFGSGYSSLSYLKRLPFDKLKIDREFVSNVHERRDSQAICRSLIELARGLGIKLLAEGVEQEAEVKTLKRFGCNLFQGFYFAKPLTAEEFVRRAADQSWLRGLTNTPRRLQKTISDRMSA